MFAPQVAAPWPYGPVTVASTLGGATMAEMAAGILATAPPRFALAGISMGGHVSFEILRRAPERVLKLALLDTTARPDAPEQTRLRRLTVARARGGEFDAVVDEAVRAMVHPARRDDPELRALAARMGRVVGVDGFARQTEAIIGRPDSRPDLPDVAVPTLVLVGDRDPLTPPDRAAEIAAAVPGARLVEIPACGHLSTRERPEAVNEALVAWITA